MEKSNKDFNLRKYSNVLPDYLPRLIHPDPKNPITDFALNQD